MVERCVVVVQGGAVMVMGVASGYMKARTCMVAERCVVGQNMVVERCVVIIQGGDVASDG